MCSFSLYACSSIEVAVAVVVAVCNQYLQSRYQTGVYLGRCILTLQYYLETTNKQTNKQTNKHHKHMSTGAHDLLTMHEVVWFVFLLIIIFGIGIVMIYR